MSPPHEWYSSGLKFTCSQCGKCCGGAPGTVLASVAELSAMAQAMGLTLDQFSEAYTRRLPSGKISLRERSSHDCVFYEADKGCTIYEQRPLQCRTWPFWRGNLATRAHWEDSAKECPGMDQGDLHGAAKIKRTAGDDGTSGFIPKLPPS